MNTVPLGQLGQLMQGLPHRFGPTPGQEETDRPAFHLLNIGDIVGLTIRPREGKTVHLPPGTPVHKYALREGDVLMTIRTRPVRAAVVLDARPPMMPTQNLALLRPYSDRLYGPYLAAYLNTPEAQAQLDGQYEQSAATPLLKLGTLAQIPIPVPPLDIQRRIADLALCFEEEERAALSALAERRALVQRTMLQAVHHPHHTDSGRIP